MPFFPDAGPPDTFSIHVYLPRKPALDRPSLRTLMEKQGWILFLADPSDWQPLGDGKPYEDWAFASRGEAPLLEARQLLTRRTAEALAALRKDPKIAQCTLVVHESFDATAELGPLDDFELTFGRKAVDALRKAKALYALVAAEGQGALTKEFMEALADQLAVSEGGTILNLGSAGSGA